MQKCLLSLLLFAVPAVHAADLWSGNLLAFSRASEDAWCGEGSRTPQVTSVCDWDATIRAQGNCQITEQIGWRMNFAECRGFLFETPGPEALAALPEQQRTVAKLIHSLIINRQLTLPELAPMGNNGLLPTCWSQHGQPPAMGNSGATRQDWENWASCAFSYQQNLANGYLSLEQTRRILEPLRALDRLDPADSTGTWDALKALADGAEESTFSEGQPVTLEALKAALAE